MIRILKVVGVPVGGTVDDMRLGGVVGVVGGVVDVRWVEETEPVGW